MTLPSRITLTLTGRMTRAKNNIMSQYLLTSTTTLKKERNNTRKMFVLPTKHWRFIGKDIWYLHLMLELKTFRNTYKYSRTMQK